MSGISRRDILRNLVVTTAAGSVLQLIPAEAAALAHQIVRGEKAASPAAKYAPKFFSARDYHTVTMLSDMIIPPDERSGGAIDAGAPEFIDLLASENEKFQLILGGGLMWLDSSCRDRFDCTFAAASPEQRKQILDLIAYRRNVLADPALRQGIKFFDFFRRMTCDAFYSSKIGIEDLHYIGNTSVAEFPGCPPLPDT